MSVDGTLGKVTDFADLDDSAIITPTNIANELGDVQEDVDELDERVDAVDERVDSIAIDGSAGPNSFVTIHDAADKMPVEAVVTMKPKQDLHGYTKPWVGGVGKNKAVYEDYSATLSGVSTVYSNGKILLNGTANGDRDFNTTYSFGNTFGQLNLGPGVYVFSIDHYQDINSGGNILYLTIRNTATNAVRYVGVGQNNVLVKQETIAENELITSMFLRAKSGSVFDNAVFMPMLASAAESDGTWEPYSNICPITGYDNVTITRSGKNLLNENDLEVGYINEGGTLINDAGYRRTKYIMVESGKTYTLSLYHNGTSQAKRVHGYDVNRNWVSQLGVIATGATSAPTLKSIAFYVPDNVKYVRIGSLSPNLDTSIQFESGSAVTPYEPYQSQSVTVNVKSANNNNTVYGGTLTINKDGSGTLVVDKVCKKFSDYTWSYSETYRSFRAANSGFDGELVAGGLQEGKAGCSAYDLCNVTTAGQMTGAEYKINIGGIISTYRILVNDPSFAGDANAFVSARGNEVIMYTLAAPTPYTLTAEQLTTVFGLNHIWSDADSISVEYSVDTQTKIEELNGEVHEELDNLESSVEAQKTSTGNPVTVTDAHVAPASVSVAIEPKQDKHGYDHPWVGGAGKNLLPMTLSEIKSANTSGTWSGNAYTISGITITVLTDSNNNVLGFKATGTASETMAFQTSSSLVGRFAEGTQLKYNGVSGGSLSTYKIDWYAYSDRAYTPVTNYGSDQSVTVNSELAGASVSYARFVLYSGYSAPTEGLTVTPMLRLATDTDATFAPYSNICPITGYDNVTVTRCGNLYETTVDKDIFNVNSTTGSSTYTQSDGVLSITTLMDNVTAMGLYSNPNGKMRAAINAAIDACGRAVVSFDAMIWFSIHRKRYPEKRCIFAIFKLNPAKPLTIIHRLKALSPSPSTSNLSTTATPSTAAR